MIRALVDFGNLLSGFVARLGLRIVEYVSSYCVTDMLMKSLFYGVSFISIVFGLDSGRLIICNSMKNNHKLS